MTASHESQRAPQPGSQPGAAPADAEIAAFDRPMRDAPAPERWTPYVVVVAGVIGLVWAGVLFMHADAAPTRLKAPPEEVEYTTGVVDGLAPPQTAPFALASRTVDGERTARASASDRARAGDARLAAARADARRHAPIVLFNGERTASTRSDASAAPDARAAWRSEAPGRETTGSETTGSETTGRDARASGTAGLAPPGARERIVRAEVARTRPDATLPQGAFIPATLETTIQSDLPGAIRAVVARDVYAADASRLLVPRGSRLVGEYRSGLVRGQSRVFAVWTRLVRPDGVSIALDAGVTDGAGRAGAAGARDSHFLERFGASVLLSLIDGSITAAANAADDGRGDGGDDTRLIVNSGHDFSRAAEIALRASVDIPPTVHVAPGTRLQVFVNRDIDFSGVIAAAPLVLETTP